MNLNIIAALAIAATGLSACGTMNDPYTGHRLGMTDTPQQCAMYRESMEGKSPAEQRAAAAAHIRTMHGSVDEAHIDRHMQMMEEMCGGKPAAGVIGRQS